MSTDFEPTLLRRINRPNSQSLSDYLADGGYEGLRKALAMGPEKVIDTVAEAALRGRGGAGFNTAAKWKFLPKNTNGPIYLCINGDESEPGTFNNRVLIEQDPHQILEGIVIAGFATNTTTAYFYLRFEYGRCYRVLEKAIAELYENNLLGKNILGSGYSLDVHLHRGAGAYICGEETGLIESLEGKRACLVSNHPSQQLRELSVDPLSSTMSKRLPALSTFLIEAPIGLNRWECRRIQTIPETVEVTVPNCIA